MIIYLIENLINHKIYVGQTVQSIKRRFSRHKIDSKNPNRSCMYLHKAMRKYGVDNFKIYQISSADSKEELDNLEKLYIRYFQSTNRELGYNIQNGGTGKGKFSKETLIKMSNAHKGKSGRKHTEETKAKLSAIKMGNKNMLGKKHSEETKKKISEAQKGEKNHMWGKTRSLETRAKVSATNKGLNVGKSPSPETRAKISRTLTGRPGRSHTAESRAKMSRVQKLIDRSGRTVSAETKVKMSEAQKQAWARGCRRSDVTIKKMSDSSKRAWIIRKATSEVEQ